MKKLLPFLAFSFSFSLSFAYTAADVYGAWNKSGSLEVGFGSDPTYTTKGYIRILDLTTIVFNKNDDEWSFIKGKINKFPNSYQCCELTSNKMMVCHFLSFFHVSFCAAIQKTQTPFGKRADELWNGFKERKIKT